MGYMLETRGLTKRFGRGDQAQDAVADVSLHIREGEVYGLLGPNGAGKSTTLKMICGMLRPTAGEILFAGHAWRREDLYAIGSLIEEAPLYPNLTARENLRVRTTLLGLPESRIDEVLAAVDLADTGKKRAGRFSMGMRQRLGLALALIARPRLLVLDEPTNGLDPIGIEELRYQIRGFAAAGTTVIVSSHILEESYPAMLTDKDRLFQILCIFMDNAIQHSKNNSLIEIEVIATEKNIAFSVVDHGQGISDEDKQYIFDRFYSGDKSHANKSNFGLGLSIAKELTQMLNGTIIINDTAGGGATFTVKFPLK